MATGAQFNRNKTWDDQKLTDTDLNAEFDNIFNNLDAAGLGSGDTSAAHARQTKDPGTYASPNIAATLQDDIQHLRYLIGQMIGGPNGSHLDPILSTLTAQSGTSTSLVFGFDFEGAKGAASTVVEAYARAINKGAILNALSLSSADFQSSDIVSSESKFGTYSYELGSTVLGFPGSEGCNPLKGSLSLWSKGVSASDGILCNPLMGISLKMNSSALLEATITEKDASGESTKNSVTVTGDDVANYSTDSSVAFKHALLSWSLNDVDGVGEDYLNISWDGTLDTSVNLSSQNIDINPGDGGVWFLGASVNEPSWDHFYAASGLPTAHTDAIWSLSGTAGTVSGGVLSIAEQATTGTSGYSTSSLVDLTQQTVEWKSRIVTTATYDEAETAAAVTLRDDSEDRQVILSMYPNRVDIIFGDNVIVQTIYGDFTDWHLFRLTSESGSYTTKLYIDGICVFSRNNDVSDTTVSDIISFGDTDATTGSNTASDWEFFKIYDAGAVPPLLAASSGYLDDVALLSSEPSTAQLTSLQSSTAFSVYSQFEGVGPYLRFKQKGSGRQDIQSYTNGSTSNLDEIEGQRFYFPSDGKTPVLMGFVAGLSVSTGSNIRVGLGISINGDMEGQIPGTGPNLTSMGYIEPNNISTVPSVVSLARNAVPPVGLVTIDVVWASITGGAYTLDLDTNESNFTMSYENRKKIGQ